MDRTEYEAQMREAMEGAANEPMRDLIRENLVYPKTSRGAEREAVYRGYLPGAGRFQRWLESRTDEEKPPRMPGVRGNTLAFEAYHVDALCAYLESIGAIKPELLRLREFGLTDAEVSKAVRAAMDEDEGECCIYHVFYFNDGGEKQINVVPGDGVIKRLPDGPLGVYVFTRTVLTDKTSGAPHLSGEMKNLFFFGHRGFCDEKECRRIRDQADAGDIRRHCPDTDGTKCPFSALYFPAEKEDVPASARPAKKPAPRRKGKK